MARWELYECSVEDARAFIAVDVDVHEEAPIPSLRTSLCVTVPILAPREDGLNTADERPLLDAIEDQLEAALTAEGATYVGRATFGGARRHYFYATSTACLEPSLRRLRDEFTGRAIEGGGFEDPAWRQYFEFLYPNELAWVYITDRRVIDTLNAEGDDGQVARTIDHWAYFARAEDRGAFAARLGDTFQVNGRGDDVEGDRPFTLRFSHHGAPASIHSITYRLHGLATEHDGEYDGWECEIVAPGAHPSA
ncbi:MAG: DUF695 domain-containing protein [Planctomycetes bacterium]|nr:DUF695 domain-containing protein [Planctomycetota bacterium]